MRRKEVGEIRRTKTYIVHQSFLSKNIQVKRKVNIPLLHVREPKNEQPVLNAENDKMCSFKYHHPKKTPLKYDKYFQ